MEIKLYKTNDEINKINKSLNSEISITGHLTEGCNILQPSILIENREDIVNYNYMYIPAFKRYYFITDLIYSHKNITISGAVDVLKTYATDIRNSKGFITRSNLGSKYLVDGLAKKLEDTKVVYKNLGSGFTSGVSYILIKGK